MAAGIEHPDVIDLVARDADGEYMVIMVETRPWGTSPEQAEQLKQKINAYAGYILDGTLISKFPEIADQPIRIHLDCVQAPSPEIAMIVDWAAGQLRAYDIAITVNVQS